MTKDELTRLAFLAAYEDTGPGGLTDAEQIELADLRKRRMGRTIIENTRQYLQRIKDRNLIAEYLITETDVFIVPVAPVDVIPLQAWEGFAHGVHRDRGDPVCAPV